MQPTIHHNTFLFCIHKHYNFSGTLQEKQPKSQFIASQHVSELIPSLIQMETTTEMTEGEHLIERPKYTGTTEITETHTMGTTNEIKRRTVLRKGNSSQDSESHEDIIIEEIIKLDDKPKEEVTLAQSIMLVIIKYSIVDGNRIE
uniref:Uncharacterized protein n=1 Tax=Cacopsylla melanoneura TaxID=428564 RepID=A0A8D8ZS73_9HEMI